MNDCNVDSNHRKHDTHTNLSPDRSQRTNTWKEKLRPSSKNKIIKNKYSDIFSQKDTSSQNTAHVLTNNQIHSSQIDKYSEREKLSNSDLESCSDKWNKYLLQSQIDNSEFEIATSNNESVIDVENSVQIFEEIENLLEENYKTAYDEHMFLKRPEHHSIIPFLLVHSKEIHRMCLSDYEIKYLYKNLKEKIKCYEMDALDYYRIGFINFYKGKYLLAFKNFHNGIKFKEKDPNILKWFCFVSIILLICEKNKINFNHFKNFKKSKPVSKEVEEEERYFIFPCCTYRKSKDERNKVTSLFDKDYFSTNSNEEELRKIVKFEELGNDIITYLKYLTDRNYRNITTQIQIESWWMLMILSTYVKVNKHQKLFDENILYDPLYCIKKIKEQNDYLSYIAYAEYNHILSDDYQIDVILNQLISKYPNKVEAYLRYWQLLKFIGKIVRRFNSMMEFMGTILMIIPLNSLYVFFTRAKSLFLVGNYLYSITYLQKEYPSNFLFPSIYYMFGKYSSKSNSKSLKYIAISALKESSRLVFKDLQISASYWLGNIYYNMGNYYLSYKFWKRFSDNAEKSFDCSIRKIDRIKVFLKKYEVLWNSITELKMNLKQIKSKNKEVQVSHFASTASVSSLNREKYISLLSNNEASKYANVELINYLQTIQSIKDLEYNLKSNKTITYEYYNALCHFYIEKNFQVALRTLMNVINYKKHFMEALFFTWKILSFTKDYKLLLYFSHFALKISHYHEVSFSSWIKCYVLYSKALKLNKNYDDAIFVLINCLDLYAHVPLESLKYLNKIYNQNKISTTNYFADFDKTLQFFSKYQVYKKNQPIFDRNKIIKIDAQYIIDEKEDMEEEDIRDENFMKNHNVTDRNPNLDTFNNYNMSCSEITPNKINIKSQSYVTHQPPSKNNTIEISYQSSAYKSVHIAMGDIGIDNLQKLEEYLDKNMDKIEIPIESPYPEIFYHIGKLCAKSSIKRELGLMCLEDYITLSNYYCNYKLTSKEEKKKQKALFWMTLLNIQLKQYNQAKQCIDQIPNLYLIENMKKESKYVKEFVEFYKQFGNPEDSFNDSDNNVASKYDLYDI